MSEILLALVIAPIATELPEKFNSLIWVRQGKDTLAMGNITGAMVFQSAIPTVVALLFAADSWQITEDSLIAFISAGMAFVAVAAVFLPMWRRARLDGRALLVGGVVYVAYLAIVILALAASCASAEQAGAGPSRPPQGPGPARPAGRAAGPRARLGPHPRYPAAPAARDLEPIRC